VNLNLSLYIRTEGFVHIRSKDLGSLVEVLHQWLPSTSSQPSWLVELQFLVVLVLLGGATFSSWQTSHHMSVVLRLCARLLASLSGVLRQKSVTWNTKSKPTETWTEPLGLLSWWTMWNESEYWTWYFVELQFLFKFWTEYNKTQSSETLSAKDRWRMSV
jgi:hypothetical protein